MGQKKGEKCQNSRVLDPAQVHFCHLTIEILEFMDPNCMMNMPSVLPIPYLQFIKLIPGGYHQPEGTAHIFYRLILVNDFLKAQFCHLSVVQRDGIEVIGIKPGILIPIMNTNLSVFVIYISYLRFKSLSFEICLNQVARL